MENIVIPESVENWIDTELEVLEEETEIKKGGGELTGDLVLLGGKHNRIAIGRPFFQKLKPKNNCVATEVKRLLGTSDFHLISLSCSFLPDKDCKFTWAQLGIRLEANDRHRGTLAEKPIAWNLFPTEVISPVNCTGGLSISPELSIKASELESSAKLFSVTSEKKWISYQPQIFSFGYRTCNIAWQFRETPEKDIYGDVRNLFMIVLTPQGSQVRGEFMLAAEVSFRGGIWKLSKRSNIQNKINLSI